MRTLWSVCAALLLTTGGWCTPAVADDGTVERGVVLDKNAAEKGGNSPVLQYALAGLLVLTVLVVVCMPSRKAQ
jgi:hypothetical protein